MSSLLKNTLLVESIIHIEDLPIKEFIRTVEAMKDKIVTEKLDGANLWFGIDDTGFFTSREGKSPKRARFYSVNDYPEVANYNGFRAAHLALEKVEPTIRKYLQEGDMVEMEVLFGRQPNTVTYGVEGKNFIVILRGVNSTPEDRVQNLSKALNKKTVAVESTIVTSPDGEKLDNKKEKQVWEFTNVEPIQGKNINTKEALALLGKMKEYIGAKNEDYPDLTNHEVAEMALTSVPKDERGDATAARNKVNEYIMNTFKAPIKELLLNHFVRKIKPMLQDKKLHPAEDIGVEGVVVRDPVTGSMTKIVDKDVFTAVNSFNSAVRNGISGLVRTTDQEKPTEMRGGAFGQAKIEIAQLLGADQLALSSGTRRYVTKFKGSDPQSTALNIAKELDLSSVPALRTKISSILNKTVKEVDGILKDFKQEAGEFRIQLKTGKEIGISPEIMKRTLTAFAETKKEIAEVNSRVLKSRTAADLIMALYGKTIESIFEGGDEVKESFSLLQSINEDGAAAAAAAGATGSAAAGGGTSSGGSIGPGFGSPSPAVSATTSAATTRAGNIAPYPVKLFGDKKIIKRRVRNFTRPKKFPLTTAPKVLAKGAKMGVPESKKSFLQSIHEETWGDQYMHFAGKDGIENSPHAASDLAFNQLRNDVAIGNEVTPMDVNRYLNKAHEINDEVDTVTFGMETDDGSVAKVYVNAAQADEFEKALATMLGQESDLEQVVNDLANKFDIVDVEWPESMKQPSAQSQDISSDGPVDETPAGPEDQEGEDAAQVDFDADQEQGPDINMEIEPEHANGPAEDGGGEDFNTDVEQPASDESGSEEQPADAEFETSDEEASEPDEDEAGEPERDDFGQIIGKPKKKKKKKAPEEEEEPAPETTEESLKIVANMMLEFDMRLHRLNEAPTTQSFANVAVQAVSDMMVAMGFDLNANRSYTYQAKQLISKNSPGIIAAKQNSVAQKIKVARDALAQAIQVSQGAPNPASTPAAPAALQQQSFSLLGSIIAETKD